MSKVTSKLQLTLPKALAERYGIRPGDDVRLEDAGEVIRMVPPGVDAPPTNIDVDARLRLFDAATARQEARQVGRHPQPGNSRGWSRGDLYERGRPSTD